ncbi:iron-containing alcohol dehydrogenase family protein [Maribacter sp. MAR_2009_72]|uniref:iron-containing alcohol dehydrogenase family protein n=1 Tax=Maribacter sp. MAR_2009_72 TaxID=1250050 RepID=UPI001199D3B6|nr:iron-containing alcohol dehydrogenase [Maribacter sp. MAR_2009_72]TVZ16173.1 alcohol dehydrogenase class IV [Maribacter sp. MAR_2009_72]
MYYIKPVISIGKVDIKSFEQFPIGKEVLIITSKTVSQNYGLPDIFDELRKKSSVHIFNHIRPDAPFEDLDLVLDELKQVSIDTIIAIGGGSTIDAAKALSIAFGDVSYKDVFYGKTPVPTTKIPLIAIPTTAGTGAELSFGAIIYDKDNGKKGGIRGEIIQPNYVFIDANLHNGCPIHLKAEVGFDCLTHAIETYISKKSNPIVRNQSVNCIQVIFQHLTKSCKENSIEDMEKVAIASSLMGINLAFSSTCLPHRIQYVIGPMTGTSHAQGLIAIYKGWLQYLYNEQVDELNQLASDLNMSTEEFLNRVNNLKKELNLDYGISKLGIDLKDIDEIASSVSGNVQADPSYENVESIINILKLAI